jgi:hypothetical protein
MSPKKKGKYSEDCIEHDLSNLVILVEESRTQDSAPE